MKLPAASCGVSKRNCAEANPPSRGASACVARALKSFGAVRHAIHPCSKLQGILAKANKTINNHLTILHKCLRDAKEWLDLEKIPKIKKLKVDPSKTDFLIQEECELLLRNTDGIWYEMILLALKTGIRFGELRALKWPDINWDTRILTVRRSIFRGLIVSPKSNKERHIPLADGVYTILKRRKRNKGYIFGTERGEIIEENKVRRARRF